MNEDYCIFGSLLSPPSIFGQSPYGVIQKLSCVPQGSPLRGKAMAKCHGQQARRPEAGFQGFQMVDVFVQAATRIPCAKVPEFEKGMGQASHL